MDISEAKALLDTCIREELRDHAFGDVEMFWNKDGVPIASGYFGGVYADVCINHKSSFKNDEARELRNCGTEGHIERNDETGPTEFVEGQIMPGLTKEGVRQELTGEG